MRVPQTTLEALVGSRIRAHVLRALFLDHDGPLWLNAILRGSNSVSGVRREVDRLLRLGVIRDRRAAGGRFFEVVVTHPLAAALTDLVDATEQIDSRSGAVDPLERMLRADRPWQPSVGHEPRDRTSGPRSP